jgi:hypothetical protein
MARRYWGVLLGGWVTCTGVGRLPEGFPSFFTADSAAEDRSLLSSATVSAASFKRLWFGTRSNSILWWILARYAGN